MSLSEAEVLNAIMLQLGREPDVTLFRNNTGQAKAEVVTRKHLERLVSLLVLAVTSLGWKPVRDALELVRSLLREPQRFTRYGLCVGSSDIIGLVQTCTEHHDCATRPDWLCKARGIFLALEVKREAGGTVSKEQQAFLDMVNRRGGVGRVVRSVDEARAAINEARAK